MNQTAHPRQLAIVGRGRLGTALAAGFSAGGHTVEGPLPRVYSASSVVDAEAILLCVPDREIAAATASLARHLERAHTAEGRPAADDKTPGRTPARPTAVGHCSGAAGLDVLDALGDVERFSLHPLMTFSGALQGAPWRGAAAAIAGSSEHALQIATELAESLAMEPFQIEDADRSAYHAAASIASNFLVTLELAAERVAGSSGLERAALVPLVRRTVENWASEGAAALTGPISRGDEQTIRAQRSAIDERAPELLAMFDALTDATRELVVTARAAPKPPAGAPAVAARSTPETPAAVAA